MLSCTSCDTDYLSKPECSTALPLLWTHQRAAQELTVTEQCEGKKVFTWSCYMHITVQHCVCVCVWVCVTGTVFVRWKNDSGSRHLGSCVKLCIEVTLNVCIRTNEEMYAHQNILSQTHTRTSVVHHNCSVTERRGDLAFCSEGKLHFFENVADLSKIPM